MGESDSDSHDEPWELNAKEKLEVLVVMIGGVLSVIGALIHLRGSITDFRRRPSRQRAARQRKTAVLPGKSIPVINIARSTSNLLLGIAFAFGSAPVPDFVEDIWFRFGTVGTCTAQGFFLQLGLLLSTLTTLALTYVYYLVIAQNVSERKLYSYYIPRLLCGVMVPSIAMAIVPFFLGAYNYFDPSICWIESYPPGCGFTNDYPCERGSAAIPYLGVCIVGIFFPILLTHMVLFQRIYKSVRTVENQTSQYAGSQVASITRSREYMRRASIGTVGDIEAAVEASVRNLKLAPSSEKDVVTSPKNDGADGATLDDSTRSNLSKQCSITNRQKSKAVGTQALLICGLEMCRLVFGGMAFVVHVAASNHRMFECASWLILILLTWISLQGFFHCALYVRPRKDQMLTVEGRWFRKAVCPSCFCETVCCSCCYHHNKRRNTPNDQDESSASSSDIEGGTSRNDFPDDHTTPQSSHFFSVSSPGSSSLYFSWKRQGHQEALPSIKACISNDSKVLEAPNEDSNSEEEGEMSSTKGSEPSDECPTD